ncbi:MAG: hypothetical protein METHP_00270 [Methanoregula sp. SKADARSKE-2]|nr:MAG: hypothetical protein METHP_00270 [Methanoregula sp. SKADARSKE-2]
MKGKLPGIRSGTPLAPYRFSPEKPRSVQALRPEKRLLQYFSNKKDLPGPNRKFQEISGNICPLLSRLPRKNFPPENPIRAGMPHDPVVIFPGIRLNQKLFVRKILFVLLAWPVTTAGPAPVQGGVGFPRTHLRPGFTNTGPDGNPL